MSEGWIKLYRSLRNKAFYSNDSEKVHLWIHLLLKANHSGREEMFAGVPFFCKSGQFTTGRKQLSIETGINESKVERILTYFEKTEQQIEQRKSNGNRLISIINWCDFQEAEQQIEQRVNNDRTTSEQRVNTLQECKESKNDNNEEKEISTIVDTKKKDEERKAEIERKKQEQKNKSDAAKAATRKRKELFYEELIPYVERYGKDMIRKFFEYWTEQNKSGTKMKYEIEKTWDLARRLGTWNNREPIGGRNLFSQQTTSTEEKECKWECQAIGLYRTGTYNQYLADVKRNNNQEVKFLGYVE